MAVDIDFVIMNLVNMKIKYKIQRIKRGWSDQDNWSFMDYMCDIIPPMIRQMKKNSISCSPEFYDEKNVNNECKQWEDILEEIAQGFEAGKAISDCSMRWKKDHKKYSLDWEDEKKEQELLAKKLDRGMELFGKHFLNLVD